MVFSIKQNTATENTDLIIQTILKKMKKTD